MKINIRLLIILLVPVLWVLMVSLSSCARISANNLELINVICYTVQIDNYNELSCIEYENR